jgi:hypothetical protein
MQLIKEKLLTIQLPYLDFSSLAFVKKNNVEVDDRSKSFDEQNRFFRSIGYTSENTIINQTFDLPDNFYSIAQSLFPNFSASVIKQDPGQVLPIHTDTFFMVSEKYGVSKDECIRVNIFLDDWQSGHYFELDYQPILHWTKGQAVIIDKDIPHLSGNMGVVPKYTMQVTGIRNEFKRGPACSG